MTTFALAPQGPGYWQGWSSFVGATFAWQAVGAADEDTSYLVLPKLAGAQGIVSFPILIGADAQAIGPIQIQVRARNTGGAHPDIRCGFARGALTVFDAVAFTTSGSYSTHTWTFATDPWDGGAWPVEDFTGLEVCVASQVAQNGSNLVTAIIGTVVETGATVYAGCRPTSAQLR